MSQREFMPKSFKSNVYPMLTLHMHREIEERLYEHHPQAADKDTVQDMTWFRIARWR